jgi:hypothetical protein
MHLCHVPIFERRDEVMCLRRLGRSLDVGLASHTAGGPVADVFGNCSVEELSVLLRGTRRSMGSLSGRRDGGGEVIRGWDRKSRKKLRGGGGWEVGGGAGWGEGLRGS